MGLATNLDAAAAALLAENTSLQALIAQLPSRLPVDGSAPMTGPLTAAGLLTGARSVAFSAGTPSTVLTAGDLGKMLEFAGTVGGAAYLPDPTQHVGFVFYWNNTSVWQNFGVVNSSAQISDQRWIYDISNNGAQTMVIGPAEIGLLVSDGNNYKQVQRIARGQLISLSQSADQALSAGVLTTLNAFIPGQVVDGSWTASALTISKAGQYLINLSAYIDVTPAAGGAVYSVATTLWSSNSGQLMAMAGLRYNPTTADVGDDSEGSLIVNLSAGEVLQVKSQVTPVSGSIASAKVNAALFTAKRLS